MKGKPVAVTPEGIDISSPELTVLPNSVRLYILNNTDKDVVRFSFVFRAGSSLQSVPFSASSTANLLSEGSTLHTAREIAEMLDYHGSYYDVSLDRDYVVLNFVCLLKFFRRTLEVAREILLMPAFDENEVRIYCGNRKQQLAIERSRIAFIARELFSAALFGSNHPYGISYDEKLYDSLRREDIVRFYESRYTAGNCFVVCSGNIGGCERDEIASLACRIPSGGDTGTPVFPDLRTESFVFRPYDGALQSSVRIGRVLFTRSHPDFIAMQFIAVILGGYFGSRLVRNLREEMGYTYGVAANIVNMQNTGYLAISTDVTGEATRDAVDRIFGELDRLRIEAVGDAEMEMVRNIMTGEIMRVLDGPFGIADVTIENIQNGTDNSYLDCLIREIRGITAERIMEVADRYLSVGSFSTVVVGRDMQD